LREWVSNAPQGHSNKSELQLLCTFNNTQLCSESARGSFGETTVRNSTVLALQALQGKVKKKRKKKEDKVK